MGGNSGRAGMGLFLEAAGPRLVTLGTDGAACPVPAFGQLVSDREYSTSCNVNAIPMAASYKPLPPRLARLP